MDEDVARWYIDTLLDKEGAVRDAYREGASAAVVREHWEAWRSGIDKSVRMVVQSLVPLLHGDPPTYPNPGERRPLYRMLFWERDEARVSAWVGSNHTVPSHGNVITLELLFGEDEGGELVVIGMREFCPTCAGTLRFLGQPCHECDGTGRVASHGPFPVREPDRVVVVQPPADRWQADL